MPDNTEKLPGTWLWGGVLWRHFGHFITESLGRLWALDHVKNPVDGVLFIPKRPNNAEGMTGYQTDLFRHFGLDGAQIHQAARPTQVERLIVPGQGFGLGDIASGTRYFRDYVQRRFGQDVAPDGPERLYISRSKLGPTRGTVVGETRLESYLEREGYEIFHPQAHDITTQIARYKAARQVIATEGSALHLFAMVARPGQNLAVVIRRRSGATGLIEKHVASFTGQTPTMAEAILREWMPENQVRKKFARGELDFVQLQQILHAGGFVGMDRPWVSMEPFDAQLELAETLGQREDLGRAVLVEPMQKPAVRKRSAAGR
nr:glycosyltransferase 61 family protein [Thalassococcus arenae]